MRRSAYESWISALSERQFDRPFLMLLRALGFYDIHCTHGAFEFGKDFIAKRREKAQAEQYAFQTKAGSIGGTEWQSILGQMEELTAGLKIHPNFDESLPRKFVLVLTGELIGKAGISASEFARRLKARGEGHFEIWTGSNLLDRLEECASESRDIGTTEEANSVSGWIDGGRVSLRELELRLARLVPSVPIGEDGVRQSHIDSSVLTAQLLRLGQPLHACTVAQHAVRVASLSTYSDACSRDFATQSLVDALDFLVETSLSGLEPLHASIGDARAMLAWVGGPGAFLSYPVLCSRVMELLGLSCLWKYQTGELVEAEHLAQRCHDFVAAQPGCVHPISDRWAASLPPAAFSLAILGHDNLLRDVLRSTTKWICDRFDNDGLGLAGPLAAPADETRHLLGSPFDFVHLQRRTESLWAVVLADLSYVLDYEIYPDVINDLRAVGAIPAVMHAQDEASALLGGSGGVRHLLNVDYPDGSRPDLLPHHALNGSARVPEAVGGPVVPLVLACLFRDRIFSDCYQRLARQIGWLGSCRESPDAV